jgi:esterase/lipase superfamily enzyme
MNLLMNKIKAYKFAGIISILFLLLLLTGCQSKVYLMPTPTALQTGEHDPFAINPDQDQTNRVVVAYATNRMGVGSDDEKKYITLFDQNLRLGAAQVRIGSEKETWLDIYGLSLSDERKGDIILDLEVTKELAELDLIIYVHGANNNFYRSSAQAAQFHHFTGRNSVVLFFSWPSAASLLRYAVDVNNARRTVPVFARLLEILAKHSVAKNFDILAYSAGAQVLSPALAELREKYDDEGIKQLKKRLRLGEVYFAAPDVDFRVFLENLATYIDLPNHVTLALNPDDSVLRFAARHHKVSRAGRPDLDELSAEETQWVINASREMPLDILWITSETIPDMSRGTHSFWYSHPWVSTDVLVQFLFQARPAERGLAEYEGERGGRVWYFPEDYSEKVSRAINQIREGQPR